jgi:Na+-transporting NADH:ubiquinone oxidoreductase subunit NqrD
LVTFVLQKSSDLDKIVNFAVMNDLVTIGKVHGLCCTVAEINDGKPPMAEVNGIFLIAPGTFSVGTAVSNGISHFF